MVAATFFSWDGCPIFKTPEREFLWRYLLTKSGMKGWKSCINGGSSLRSISAGKMMIVTVSYIALALDQ